MCGGVFKKSRPDEDALVEATAVWGKSPDEWIGGSDVVCDPCYRSIDPETHPQEAEVAKQGI